MSKRTLFLIFALFVIISVLLAITLYKPNSSNTAPAQTVTPGIEQVEQTTLSFGDPVSVATPSSIANLTYSLPINIATGKNKVTSVQLELQYEPSVLSNVSIVSGWFFKNPLVLLDRINAKTGRITYAFGIGLTDQGISGEGVAATLTFQTSKTPLQTAILFLPKTLVTAQGITQSVVKRTNNIQFDVGEIAN